MAVCGRAGIDIEGTVLLWSVCENIRKQLEGSLGADVQAMARGNFRVSLPVNRVVNSLPLFGGQLGRGAAPGAVLRLKRALCGKQKICFKLMKTVSGDCSLRMEGGGPAG